MQQRMVTLHGPPVTPELQLVFGHLGDVKGLAVANDGSIWVDYTNGHKLRFVPETPLGETVCRSCQSVHDAIDQRRDAQTEFYTYIEEVDDPAVKRCLEALFHLARGDER